MPQTPQEWVQSVNITTESQPSLHRKVGVSIECRLMVESDADWGNVQEILTAGRKHGSAEVDDYQIF